MEAGSIHPGSGSNPREPMGDGLEGWGSEAHPLYEEVRYYSAHPDPAEQAPLVARSVTPPSPSGRERGDDDTASAACTSILYRVCYDPPPMNTHVTSEGGRDDRGVPYHMRNRPYPVLKCSINLRKERIQRQIWLAHAHASCRTIHSLVIEKKILLSRCALVCERLTCEPWRPSEGGCRGCRV